LLRVFPSMKAVCKNWERWYFLNVQIPTKDKKAWVGFVFVFVFFFTFFFFYCAEWGYIVAFTKVLTVYQIYHTWMHPLHHSPLSPFILFLLLWFSRYHFSNEGGGSIQQGRTNKNKK
jgi:hypothetical protein